MAKSMTGYGLSQYKSDELTIAVEVKSLNSKFMDIALKIPKEFSEKEMDLRKLIGDAMERGKTSINMELRFPIIRYFHRGPISSNFFRNLILIGFYDLGSAWSGPAAFANKNNLNATVIKDENSPFQATIKNFSNPWLYSYGTGIRTVLLGYFMKFDVAWPVQDFEVGSPGFYVTLGYDF